MDQHDAEPGGGGLAVTVAVSRRPQPGREDDLVAWARGVGQAAAAFPGHLGAQIYPPDPPDRDDLVIVFSFATAADLSRWEGSDVRREWLERSRPLVVGEPRSHSFTGFESLFGAPGVPMTPPPRWKTGVIIALALYPASLLVGWLLTPLSLPAPLRVLVSTVLIVPYMVFLGVPYLSRWLHRWLKPAPPPTS